MNNGYSLCVLCCCSFGTDSHTNTSIYREDLLNFFKLLVSTPPTFTQNSKPSIADLQTILDNSGLSICNDCHAFITVALETRSRAEQMEIKVRKLQLQILEQMRMLQCEMDLFQQEMSKLEDVVKTSDESCLMFHMPRESQGGNGGRENGILVLRARILDVVTDLRIYQVNPTHANLPNNPSDLEAMWEDAQQLVQCTPDISMDYDDNDIVEDLNDSSGEGGSHNDVHLGKILGGGESAKLYMGHSVGARFYVEGESDDAEEEERIPNKNFKADVIRRAQVREQNRTPEQNRSLDPLRRYYLKYDGLLDTITVGNIEVIISSEDETLKCSQCTIVGKRSKLQNKLAPKQNWRDMEKGILVHIIGKHLGGFTCAHCKEVFTSHTMIKKHMSKEHPGHTVSAITTNPLPLAAPSPSPAATTPGKKYGCSMCPREFRKPSELKKHFLSAHANHQDGGEVSPLIIIQPSSPPPATSRTRKPCPRSRRTQASPPPPQVPPPQPATGVMKIIPTKSAKRPHECHICLYAFTKGSHLKRHLEIHRKRNELV